VGALLFVGLALAVSEWYFLPFYNDKHSFSCHLISPRCAVRAQTSDIWPFLDDCCSFICSKSRYYRQERVMLLGKEMENAK